MDSGATLYDSTTGSNEDKLGPEDPSFKESVPAPMYDLPQR